MLKRDGENGFSLLEAVISMAIAGFIMTAFFETTSTNLKLTDRSTEKAKSAILIQTILNKIGTQIPLQRSIVNGSLENGHSWRLEMQPIQLSQLGLNAQDRQRTYRLNVQIFDEGTNSPIDQFETYRVGIE